MDSPCGQDIGRGRRGLHTKRSRIRLDSQSVQIDRCELIAEVVDSSNEGREGQRRLSSARCRRQDSDSVPAGDGGRVQEEQVASLVLEAENDFFVEVEEQVILVFQKDDSSPVETWKPRSGDRSMEKCRIAGADGSTLNQATKSCHNEDSGVVVRTTHRKRRHRLVRQLTQPHHAPSEVSEVAQLRAKQREPPRARDFPSRTSDEIGRAIDRDVDLVVAPIVAPPRTACERRSTLAVGIWVAATTWVPPLTWDDADPAGRRQEWPSE